MADLPTDVDRPPRHGAPGVVAPTNRVTVAFPFSKITIEETGDQLPELTAIVLELIRLIETVAPGEAVEELRRQAEALEADGGA